jgi:general secretion pathway protein D
MILKRSVLTIGLLVSTLGAQGAVSAQENGSSNHKYVNFTYDQVEIRILAEDVGRTTGRRLIVGPDVTGKVNVITPEKIHIDDVYPLFVSVLESAGYSVVEQDGTFTVVPLPKTQMRVATIVGVDEEVTGSGIIFKIKELKHISAMEVKRSLDALMDAEQGSSLSPVPSSNHLLIKDTSANVRRIEQIVDELDRPGAASSVVVVPLKHASARSLALQISRVMRGMETTGTIMSRQMRAATSDGLSVPAGFTAVPAEESNSLILIGTPIQLVEAQRTIEQLDVEGTAASGRMHAIGLNYIDADEAAKNLSDLLTQSENPEQPRTIVVQANTSTQTLIVDASPHDFLFVQQLVKRLDQKPKQVLVDVLIAEVTLGDQLDLGVELATIEQPKDGSTTVIGRSRPGEEDGIMKLTTDGLFAQGLSLGVARGTIKLSDDTEVPAIPFLLTALAQEREINIISNPSLLAENNKEATVMVVDDIPLLKSEISAGAGTARDIIQEIERRDVGLKLTLTPHINDDNEIQLELNPVIEAIVDEGDPDTPFTPTIARREVKTTVTLEDEQTVVISGLIREDRIRQVSKVPFLGDMPLLGHLFKKTEDRKQRTNLLIFVTPHLVVDSADADRLRRELETRTELEGILTNSFQKAEAGEP